MKWFVASLALFALSASALAQDLADYLPEDTVVAFGVHDLNTVADKLDPFFDEWDRLELTELLGVVFADGADELDPEIPDEADDLLAELEGLTVLDVLGEEAWIAVSASRFNPLPAFTVLARPSSAAFVRATALMEEHHAAHPDAVEELREGDYLFYLERLDDPDAPADAVAYTVMSDLIALSSNPDVLRGVLRRYGGADEPSFVTSDGYRDTLGRLDAGNLHTYFDYSSIGDSLLPFAQGMGFDEAANRLQRAFATFGLTSSVLSVTDDGFVTEGWQRIDPDGRDETLQRLLADAGAIDPAGLNFVPEEAISYSLTSTDLAGWWQYLNELAATVPELGGDLNMLVLSFIGLDIDRAFFSWTEPAIATATLGLAEVTAPGMPVDNFLGELVYAIRTSDEAAAQAGLDEVFEMLAMTLAMFADPMGDPGEFQAEVEEVAGVTVTHYDVVPGLSLSYAVTDGHALIATSRGAIAAAIDTTAQVALPSGVPADATRVGYTDTRRSLEGTAQGLRGQVEMAAGLTGAAGLDFDAVTQASAAIEEFVNFVASRAGESVNYTVVSDDGIYSYSTTEVTW